MVMCICVRLVKFCMSIYSQACIKRSPLGQRNSGLIRQVILYRGGQSYWWRKPQNNFPNGKCCKIKHKNTFHFNKKKLKAFDKKPDLSNLLLDDFFKGEIQKCQVII
jgi:hypothetical protein